MSSFQHQPLDDSTPSFRLANFLIGHWDDPIACELVHHKPGSVPYQALSYVWGDATRTVPIYINGKTFQVTENLHSALRHLREYHSDNLCLWIDAICIDQSNVTERNEQVQRMRSIYERAIMVIVWLGEDHEPEDDEVVFSRALWSFEKPRPISDYTCLDLARRIAGLNAPHIYLSRGSVNAMQDKNSWAHLRRIFSRRWFSRLWILQEVAENPNICCVVGLRWIRWATLSTAAARIVDPAFVKGTDFPEILPLMRADNVIKVSLGGADRGNLLTVLREVQDAQCSDLRDKLFALKGLLDPEEAEEIDIDYSKSVDAVYADWAWKRMNRWKPNFRLDVFSICADSANAGTSVLAGPDESFKIPSWTPDLRKPLNQDNPLFVQSHRMWRAIMNTPWAAARSSSISRTNPPLHFERSQDGLKLSLVGCAFDRVAQLTTIGDPTQSLVNPILLSVSLQRIIEDWESDVLRYFRPERMDKAVHLSKMFSETLLRGLNGWGSHNTQFSLLRRYEVWRGLSQAPRSAREDDLDGFAGDMERVLFTMVHGCQMLITQNGRLGIVAGNCHVMAGDQLWVLPGGITPFVLRHAENTEYRLMGPCYVHGYMNGQAVDEMDSRGEAFTQLTLI